MFLGKQNERWKNNKNVDYVKIFLWSLQLIFFVFLLQFIINYSSLVSRPNDLIKRNVIQIADYDLLTYYAVDKINHDYSLFYRI